MAIKRAGRFTGSVHGPPEAAKISELKSPPPETGKGFMAISLQPKKPALDDRRKSLKFFRESADKNKRMTFLKRVQLGHEKAFGEWALWFFFSFQGRIKRLQFFFGFISAYTICFLLAFLLLKAAILLLPPPRTISALEQTVLLMRNVFIFASLAASLSAWSLIDKRLNDLGRSWRFSLLILVPFLNILFFLYLCFKKSAPDPNPPEAYHLPHAA